MDDVIEDRYSGIKIHEVNKPNKFRKFRENIGQLGFKIEAS
jgi:hypothetical protein